ncbi:Oidioi.mRNA.OKI2018_I69.PAR.g11114.t1.cds [Oikopleura dioica]|uniref:Oidioi.mRNA.OKI2018_I69.PAR.g11114.t1.cds n=1 Tax=Oikopleura dioica TaxID=34765 RepID=A0ABN7RYH3_OIKDI|nr:Oidioi.mRNA.OKI2018_I69.PAR.g11114.t1.cds [Oikopleura dioica]
MLRVSCKLNRMNPVRSAVQYVLAERNSQGQLKPANIKNLDGESFGIFTQLETNQGTKMARIQGFRKIVHKNIAGKITIPENLKDIVDGLSSGTIQATVDGKKKEFPYYEMDEELLQLPILQLSTIVVAFDVVQIGNMLTRIVSRVVRRAAGTEFVLARRVGDELVEVKFSEDDAEKLKQLAYNSGLTADVLMNGEKALARLGGFSTVVKTNQKGTVKYWRQEKSKPDWGYIQPLNMMEDSIAFNAADSDVAAYQVKGKAITYDVVARVGQTKSQKAVNINVDEDELDA